MPRIAEVFGDQVHYYDVEVGSTINDFMIFKNPQLKNFPIPVIAGTRKPGIFKPNSVEDVTPVLRKDWDNPLAEIDIIVLVAVLEPKGGGKNSGNIFQIVLGVVMVIVGIVTSATGIGSSLVVTGIGLILSGVVGMIMQPRLPSGAVGNEEAYPTFSFNGSANQARLLQPVPEGFGKIGATPDIVAQPYYTYENNDQYLYQVFGIGRGTYEVHTMSFGEEIFWRNGVLDSNSSLITSQNDVQIQLVAPGESVTLFPDNVESNPNVSGIRLYATNEDDYTGWMGPYTASPPGTSSDKYQIDFIFPQGVGRYDDKAKIRSVTIVVGIEYQEIDDYGNALGVWLQTYFQISMNTLTPQRRSMFVYPNKGRYQFRFVNTSETSTDKNKPWQDEVRVDGLRCYLPGTLKYTQSCIAVKIKATNNLSSNAQQQFRTVQTRILPIWDQVTKTWSVPVATRRLDAAIAQMCKSEWGGNLTDDRIDLDALAYCQSKCDEMEWNFDTFIDSPYTVLDLVIQSCLPYRVFPRLLGDKVSFMYDEKNRPIRHVFTPRDIVRGSLSPKWATHSDSTPDDVIVSYLDEDIFYARREVQATLPDSESREPKYLQYPVGVCNRKLAHDYGLYVAACNKFRRLSLDFGVETLGRLLHIGDIVSVQHPRLRSAGFGKVVDWDESTLKIYVDTMPTMDSAAIEKPNLWMILNDPQGSPWGPVKLTSFKNCCAQMDSSDFALVVGQSSNPFNWMTLGYQSQPTTWALQTGKNIDRRYIIQAVQFQDLEHATLTVMNDDPRVFDQKVPVPLWEYRQNNVMWTKLLPPDNFRVGYFSDRGVVGASWSGAVGAVAYEFEYGGSRDVYSRIRTDNLSVDVSVELLSYEATNYFRVRSVDQSSFSKWKEYILYVGLTESTS
jgi:hypothetical protein